MPSGSWAGVGGGITTPSYMKKQPAATSRAPVQQQPLIPGLGGQAQSVQQSMLEAAQRGGTAPATPGSSSGGGSSDSSGSGSLTLKADTNASLEALRNRYTGHLDDIKGNTGHFMDLAGSRIRDAREGGKAALQQDSMFRGAASDPSLAAYEADTTGAVAGAVADVAAGREQQYTNALQGGVAVAGAPEEQALREKQLQVNAYQAESASKNQNFASWLALLNASRTSPIYTG